MGTSTITISAGHTSTGLVADANTHIFVHAGGTAINTTINTGGLVRNRGTADNTTINGTGALVDNGAGVDLGTIVHSGGDELLGADFDDLTGLGTFISPAGTAIGTTLFSGGFQGIYDFTGLIYQSTVFSGGEQAVGGSGGTVTGANVTDGLQEVEDGGTAISTTLDSAGSQHVLSGGVVSDTQSLAAAIRISSRVPSSTMQSLPLAAAFRMSSLVRPPTTQASRAVYRMSVNTWHIRRDRYFLPRFS